METNNSVATATTNGQLASPQMESDSASSLTPGKRKRVSSPEQESSKDDGISTLSETPKKESLDQILKDLLQVLAKYDSDLGILTHPLPSHSIIEPDCKRAKLADSTGDSQTIQSKIASGKYRSIQSVIDDVEIASIQVVKQQREAENSTTGSTNLRSPNELVNLSRIFKKHLDNFILRSPFQGSSLVKDESRGSSKSEAENKDNIKKAYNREDKMVLTLFGNAPRGRHLFSSLQQTSPDAQDSLSGDETNSVGIQTSVNETSLPNGISISEVIPFNVKSVESDKKNSRTLADVFPPRPTLPQLQPPRKARPSKSSNATWLDSYDVVAAVKSLSHEKRGYSYTPLPSGHWLHYAYEPSIRPGNRRHRSDANIGRGLSKPFQNSLDDGNATFRGVYSSFAPSFDSSGAVIPEDAKEQIWWDKSGMKRMHALLSAENESDVKQIDTPSQGSEIQPLDETSLEELVKSYEPDADIEMDIEQPENTDGESNEKDLEEVLEHISDLLRTLNSYRQIRNLATSGQPASGKQADEPTAASDATTPSSEELTVYETLKTSLSAMVATLPPYAVSKLDGDQLAELNISKKILLESADYPGTMEEDDYTIQQKQMPRVSQVPNVARTPTPNMHQSRTSPYQTPPAANVPLQRGYPSNPRAKPIPMNHPSAYGARPPSASMHYPPNNSPQPYNPSRQPIQRPSYGQPQFPQHGTPQQYTPSSILQQFQRPVQNGAVPYPSQRIASPAQGSPQPYPHRSSQPPYPQRPQDGPYSAAPGGPPNASPQRHASFGASPQRHPYMTSTPNNPQQPRYFQQQTPQPPHFPNFPNSQASPAPGNGGYSNTAAAITYARSAAEQAALMDRNKAQLAEHQRQNSGTPQPVSSNGQFTPNTRQNGTPVGVGGTSGSTQ
ncbi:hypothetical protein FQN52_006006 [Onygenales sp. PD_12]|nr:hypothetical protein FQN52_006006 [Onygenales sp. PD_12]